MTLQRRRGVVLRIWKSKVETNRRGDDVKLPDADGPHEVRGWVIPDRSARGEVPGQLQINVIKVGVPIDLEGVDLWSTVEVNGSRWDIAAPPAAHGGTRHTRHWSVVLRQRPT